MQNWMRLAAGVILFCGSPALAAEPAPPPPAAQQAAPDSTTELAKRYVAALAADDAAACAKLWFSSDQFRQIFEHPPQGVAVPPAAEREKALDDIKKRQVPIQAAFPKLVKALKSQVADLKVLKFESVDAQTQVREGVEVCSMFTIRASDPKSGKKFELRVDDGFKMNGGWYFADKPLLTIHVVDGGKTTKIEAQ